MSELVCNEVAENIHVDVDVVPGAARSSTRLPRAADDTGDRLVLSDGRQIEVISKAEPLYEVRGSSPHALLQLAWHIGNRHLATEIHTDHLRIRADSVVRDMLTGLGADVQDIDAGFHPENGAYGHKHAAHDHDHGHDHSH